jgi:hypothetical protein
VDFQVTVLKVLVSSPDGFACLDDLKRDIFLQRAVRTGPSAPSARIPNLAIFSQGLVERLDSGWRITQQGRHVLAIMERQ